MPTQRVGFFDIWRPGYNGATVTIYVAGTTTLASVYTDEALTVAAANPQTLKTYTEASVSYGQWTAPLYTSQAVSLKIDNDNDTGIVRPPITDMTGQDVSNSNVTTTAGSRTRPLDDRFDDVIHAEDYGTLGAVAATNNTTLSAAIGVASANGGGIVSIPSGTYEFTSLTLSTGVVLKGEGRGVTILQCQTGGDCITLGGDRAGLANLTFDGVAIIANSVGVFSKANNETTFIDADVKRFETGLHFKGGRAANWKDLYVTNCATGAKLHGDNDAGGGANGDEYSHNEWTGGTVSLCTVLGVHFSFVDKKCWHNTLTGVGFDSNTGIALQINGARYTTIYNPWFTGNTATLDIQDDSDTTYADLNTVIGLKFYGGMLSGGTAALDGTCQDIILDGMEISNVDFTLTAVTSQILFRDCIEDSLVTLAGNGERITRLRAINKGASSGVTTDAVATKAWAVTLLPGEFVYLVGKIIGNQRNGIGQAGYHIGAFAHRPGSTLAYDNQTVNYTVGDLLTGTISGATGRITVDVDAGTTGTLTLKDISGVFQNNETITDGSGGSATANGILVPQNSALRGASDTIKTLYEDNAAWTAAFVANGSEIELQVTGEAAKTVDWTCQVEAVFN